MSWDFQVTVDCADPHPLAQWWAMALGWDVEPTDEEFIRSMVTGGYATAEETTTYRGKLVWRTGAAIVQPTADAGGAAGKPRRVLFQLVPEPKSVKNRVHLDVRVPAEQLDSEVQRLVSAGARYLHTGQQGPHRWVTLADPEGNEFCVG